ncbi:M48 family metallopeptidase [Dokdonella sp.]|uniref:M48 family metallopeptidase n=2 Tax=Dokdonella sp. TaxID=2291710 RepID=UPI002C98A8BF|nr:M48 family metallopeptidase [Dokdonella sp.]HOX70124.1 M48 family metallopeptidase [Dokdonella sp.]
MTDANHMAEEVFMDRELFDQLVSRLEAYSRLNPKLYKLRVFGFALLGYGYLLLMFVLMLLLLVASALSVIYFKALGMKLLLITAPFAWLVARSFWVRMNAPQGYVVDRRMAPALFERIRVLRKKLRAPRFHRVVITDDFNAAVVQIPRLGPVGWHANYLLVGMPLMKSVSPTQLDAILAHEFGHLAGGHARFGNWLYRLRRIWSQLLDELERRQSAGLALFRGFFTWYVPRFNAYSFPLARANEFEADAVAARVTSVNQLAEALTTTAVVGRYLGAKYWPGVYAKADTMPQPSFAPHAALGEAVNRELDDRDVEIWMGEILAQPADSTDTHPGLADRLRAIGGSACFKRPAEGSSADYLLGPVREQVIRKLDGRWQFHVSEDWRRRYSEVWEARNRLAAQRKLWNNASRSTDELIEYANLEELHGEGRAAAVALLGDRIAQDPDHAGLNYWLGTRLLADDDESGIELVEKAIAMDEAAIVPGNVALRDFYHTRGLVDLAKAAHGVAAERQALLDAADSERQTIRLGDKLLAHGLDADAVNRLYEQITRLGARKIWIARKPTRLFPEHPLFLLAFSLKPWYSLVRRSGGGIVSDRIHREVTLPGQTIVICTDGEYYRFRRKLRFIRGTRLRSTAPSSNANGT